MIKQESLNNFAKAIEKYLPSAESVMKGMAWACLAGVLFIILHTSVCAYHEKITKEECTKAGGVYIYNSGSRFICASGIIQRGSLWSGWKYD
jgi:hypothetical protein